MNKRISNRKHPDRICKKPDCKKQFTPADKRQIYCTQQHRVDHNNDLRDLKDKPHKVIKQINLKNQEILAKIYRIQKAKNYPEFNYHLLEVDDFDRRYYTDSTMVDSKIVYWNYHYGVQGVDSEKKLFITHFRKTLPFLI